MRYVACHFVLAVIVLQPFLRPALAQSGTVRGITFTVDTAMGYGPVASMLGRLALKVTYAGTRGRIDVLARSERPAVRAKWVILSPSAISPGDYFLFDSTGFTLVRPAKKNFTPFRLANGCVPNSVDIRVGASVSITRQHA